MTTTKKVLITLGVVAVGAVIVANLRRSGKKGIPVAMHAVKRSDIISKVSCTGRIQAKRKVDVSANVMGQMTNLAVREGDRVEKGQFLLQIDHTQLKAQATGSEAALAALFAERDSSRVTRDQTERDFARSEKNYQEHIVSEADFQRARSQRDSARANLEAVERRIEQARAALSASRDNLSKTTMTAPIAGIVTALPVEEGEIAVIGTMNNPGTKLMTISDMSEVESEMEVDETDVPRVKLGQKATLTIDAFPDQTFEGTVSEIGSSPIARTTTGNQAIEFSVKIVLLAPPEAIRPGFSVSGQIETGERKGVVAIPVQALVVQDLAAKVAKVEDKKSENEVSTALKPATTPAGKSKDVEGVYRISDGKVAFVAVKTGLQGELLVEVTEGLKEGDSIVTGPFRVLRTLKDGDLVRDEEETKKKDEGAPRRAS